MVKLLNAGLPMPKVESWKVVAAMLAGYGFLKEIRPSEPYIIPFLTGPDKNFTAEQVNQQIFPVSTYSTMVLLVAVFLLTDYLRYKPVIVAQGLAAGATFGIIAWGSGVPLMQFMEVLYGLTWAADVAYFTYMYAKVGRSRYGTVSATARVGYLLGRCGSGVLSQVTVSLKLLSLLSLQYITVGASAAATVFAIALPPVATSFYFHKSQQPDVELAHKSPGVEVEAAAAESGPQTQGPPPGAEPRPSFSQVAQLLWADFKEAFTQVYVIKWSVWWALATAGQMMVLNYNQVLWNKTIAESDGTDPLLNGAVEAAYTLLGAGAVWLTTRKEDYSSWGDGLVGAWSLGAGGVVLVAAHSRSMVVQYVTYVAFATSFHAAITIASSEVMKCVREDAHALVFGLNQFAALLLQTVLTFVVAGEGGLELDIRTQFVIYGAYFLAVGAAFLVVAAVALCRRR